MLDILTSKMERYREFGLGSSADELLEAAKKLEADELVAAANKLEADKLAKEAAERAAKNTPGANPSVTNKLDDAATGTKPTPEAAAAAADKKFADNIDPKKADEITAANKKKATADETADADELAKSEGMINYCKNNTKTCIALGGASALALYMVINGKTNPAQAAGEMAGDAVKGVLKGLLDGLGLGFLADYLPYMSACCSCFMLMFLFLYIFKTFIH